MSTIEQALVKIEQAQEDKLLRKMQTMNYERDRRKIKTLGIPTLHTPGDEHVIDREAEIMEFIKDDGNLSIYADEDEDDVLMVILKMDKHIQKMKKTLNKIKLAVKD